MGFLEPFALFGALAASVPILLHFWRREQQDPPNLFPGVFFLVDTSQPVPQRARPLTWLLTALRASLIGLLALVIAGPYHFTRQAQALPENPVLLALVIDDSPSMALPATGDPAGGTRLDAYLAEANRLIDGLPAGSGLIWTTTSGRFHPLTLLAARAPGAAGAEIADGRAAAHLSPATCPPSDAAGDLGRALDRVANALLELAYPQRRVVVLSDLTVGLDSARSRELTQAALRKLAGQHTAVSLLDPALGRPGTAGEPPLAAPRLKILSLDRPSRWRVGRPVTLAVHLLFDAEPAGSASPRAVQKLTWTLGDETVEQLHPQPAQAVDLPGGLRLQTFELARRFTAEGWWKLQVAAEIDADRQDALTTYLPVAAATPVWLVEGPDKAGDSRYLALAIDPAKTGRNDPNAGNDWNLVRKSYADLEAGLPTDGVLVLWGAGRGLPAADWDRIAAAAAQGMGVWFVPDGGPLPTHRDHPWIFWSGNPGAESAVLLPRRLSHAAALNALPIRGQLRNPIRSALQAVARPALEAAAVETFYPLRTLENGVDTLLAVDAGGDALNPGLVEKSLGRGVGLLLTTPPIAGNGGLVQAELWPLLVGLSLERLAPTVGDWPDGEVGRPLPGQAGGGCRPPFRLAVVTAAENLPGYWEFGAASAPTQAAGGETETAGIPAAVLTHARPISHFFRNGRFHFEGEMAPHRGVLVIVDSRGRLVGVQSAQIASREWDDSRLGADFWQAPGADEEVAPMATPAVSAQAVLSALRENETRPAAQAEIAVTIHGDLTPWVLAVLLFGTLPWMWLERREYGTA